MKKQNKYAMNLKNKYYKKYLSLKGVECDNKAFREFVDYEEDLVERFGKSVLNEGA